MFNFTNFTMTCGMAAVLGALYWVHTWSVPLAVLLTAGVMQFVFKVLGALVGNHIEERIDARLGESKEEG